MRVPALVLLTMLLAACSCERKPVAEPLDPAPQPAALGPQQPVGVVADDAADVAADAARRAESMRAAVSTVHEYLGRVVAKDWAAVDVFWAGGKSPANPGDQILRTATDLRSMRINTDAPKSLDDEPVPQALDVPVVLRLTDGTSRRELRGSYRLRRDIDGSQWKLTSASLTPAID